VPAAVRVKRKLCWVESRVWARCYTACNVNCMTTYHGEPAFDWILSTRGHIRLYPNHLNPKHALISSDIKLQFNIILPSIPRYFKWSLSFKFCTRIIYAFSIYIMCDTSPSHLTLLFWSPWYVAKSTYYVHSHYVISSLLLLKNMSHYTPRRRLWKEEV
jgi:hypothetical protein